MHTYQRRTKEAQPVLAICYDFDKTLSPDDMQAQGFIQSIGYEVDDFWKAANVLAQKHEMDSNLAYMLQMLAESKGHMAFTKQMLRDWGKRVILFDGVESWFERIRRFAESCGIIVEHYVISSGLLEMIEGTSIAQKGAFERIYASSFCYSPEGVAIWPAQVVNFTNKTQFLFRISKGILDINDPGVNDYFPADAFRVPFRNMIYIGDSDTDVPCMKLINDHGGHSICVYNPKTGDKSKVHRMMREGRSRYFAPADYTEDSALELLVKAIVQHTAASALLEAKHHADLKEALEAE